MWSSAPLFILLLLLQICRTALLLLRRFLHLLILLLLLLLWWLLRLLRWFLAVLAPTLWPIIGLRSYGFTANTATCP